MNEKIEIVSSFGLDGYREYGRRFLTSMETHLPANVTLTIYNEWEALPTSSNIRYRNLLNVPYVARTLKMLDTPVTRGSTPDPTHAWKQKALDEGYNFRFDAFKFCRKVMAIEDAAVNSTADKLFWLDADTVALAPIPHSLFVSTLPDGCDVSRLFRGDIYHSECGFVGYRLNKKVLKFIMKFANTFVTGNFKNYTEWHDSFIFDRLIDEFPDLNVFNIPHNSKSQPFDFSELGQYLVHLKGPKKSKGVNEQAMRDWNARRTAD